MRIDDLALLLYLLTRYGPKALALVFVLLSDLEADSVRGAVPPLSDGSRRLLAKNLPQEDAEDLADLFGRLTFSDIRAIKRALQRHRGRLSVGTLRHPRV